MILDEKQIRLRKIRAILGRPSKRVLEGLGAETSVTLPPSRRLVAASETLIEGVHFDLSYTTARELGHKSLAIALSQLAIRGSRPLYAFVSSGLTQHLSDPFLMELLRGMSGLARRFDVDIVNHQTVASPTALVVSVTLIGQATEKLFTRTGARPGDLIAVTGNIGASAAGLNCLKRLGRDLLHGEGEILKAHLSPEPRVREALALQKTGGVTAAGHISDSLSKEIHQIAEGSGVGAWIDEAALPISEATKNAANRIDSNAKAWALYGGEDYELLLTVNPKYLGKIKAALHRLGLGSGLHIIGEIKTKRSGVFLKTTDGDKVQLAAREWNHFVRRLRKR